MGQLHELMAVEGDVKSTTQKILLETQNTFSSKKEHFNGSIKTYSPHNASDQDLPENEIKPIVTTVGEKLKYIMPFLAKNLDIILQKESTSCIAKADLQVEDSTGKLLTLKKEVPVIVLVQYEKLLTQVRGVLDQIPTLDPNFQWKEDKTKSGVYITDPVVRVRTKKIAKPIVLYQATDKHPAQTQLISDDVPVGNWTQILSSGSLSPLEKSQLLGKIDRVIEGVKKARARANKTEVVDGKIGKEMLDFILA